MYINFRIVWEQNYCGLSIYLCWSLSDSEMVVVGYFVKRFVILHYVETMIGSGRFNNLDLLKSVEFLGVIFKILKISSLYQEARENLCEMTHPSHKNILNQSFYSHITTLCYMSFKKTAVINFNQPPSIEPNVLLVISC